MIIGIKKMGDLSVNGREGKSNLEKGKGVRHRSFKSRMILYMLFAS